MFRRLLILSLSSMLCFVTSAAHAASPCAPTEAPVRLSASKHYFEGYRLPKPSVLLGQSYEYLCHVDQGQTLSDQYCSYRDGALGNYKTLFSMMQDKGNNVIRLQAIFNHSPGTELGGAPYVDEQPFKRVNGKWSLYTLTASGEVQLDKNDNYFEHLDDVLCDAYNKGIIVELCLFNVWDGHYTSSPFNKDNAVALPGEQEGFTDPSYFMTTAGQSTQDQHTRAAQMAAVVEVVNSLKKYPNLIWEVANEPDFILLPSVTPAQVLDWEKMVVSVIRAHDTTHLIEIEGHTKSIDPTKSTFAWNEPQAGIEAAHYVKRNDTDQYGAITLLRDKQVDPLSHPLAMSFNENRPTPGANRTAGDVRSEAWEFVFNGGALFDGYSTDFTNGVAATVSAQLKPLHDFLANSLRPGGISLDAMRQASCHHDYQAGDWCWGIPDWGLVDQGCAKPTFWSTMSNEADGDYALYVHHGRIDPATPNAKGIYGLATYKEEVCGDGVSTGYSLNGLRYRVKGSGCYEEIVKDPETGLRKSSSFRDLEANIDYEALASSRSQLYKQDVLFYLTRWHLGGCYSISSFTASFTVNCDYLWCTFDASGSTPASAITSYVWSWGDSTAVTSTGIPTQLHVFANPGTYPVTLTVNGAGGSDAVTIPVTVVSQPPTPIFSVICQGLTCTFDASNSRGGSGGLVAWSWSFGDGTGGSGFFVTHTYAAGGNYAVRLTVTDLYNVSASLTQTIAVAGPPPVASFLFTCSGLTCGFDAGGSTGGNPLTYSWSFGDAGGGSGTTGSHTYAAGGSYLVTLTVTDNVQRQSTYQRLVTVTNDPVLPGESYFALPPCRVLDTRIAPLAALNNGQAYTFQVAGKCGIPSTAKAVSLNVTAVSPTSAGNLDLYPGDKTATYTTVDFDPARSARGNNTIEQLATNGAGTVGVLASLAGSPGQVHLVLDVDGYFSEDTTPAPGARGPLGYQPITPCRLLDTRTTSTPLLTSTARTISIQGSCGIPSGAVAAALNVAIVSPTATGFLALYPSNQPTVPGVSSLNWVTGTTALANGARPMLAPTTPSDLVAYPFLAPPGTTAHLVVDTVGYFKSGAPYKFHPIAQCRAVYTAMAGAGAPSLAAGTTRSFQIQGNCGVPVGAKAAFISTKILAPNTTTGGLLLLFPSGGSANGTSFMNFDAGEPALAGGAIVALSNNNLDISVATSSNVDLIVKVFGYFD